MAREAGARVEGIDGGPPGELIVTAAAPSIYDTFHDALVDAGFAHWPW